MFYVVGTKAELYTLLGFRCRGGTYRHCRTIPLSRTQTTTKQEVEPGCTCQDPVSAITVTARRTNTPNICRKAVSVLPTTVDSVAWRPVRVPGINSCRTHVDPEQSASGIEAAFQGSSHRRRQRGGGVGETCPIPKVIPVCFFVHLISFAESVTWVTYTSSNRYFIPPTTRYS